MKWLDLLLVDWNVGRKDLFSVRIKVIGQDNAGVLKTITECISGENINISSVDLKVKENISTSFFLILGQTRVDGKKTGIFDARIYFYV